LAHRLLLAAPLIETGQLGHLVSRINIAAAFPPASVVCA
jgi:hypothetical protein